MRLSNSARFGGAVALGAIIAAGAGAVFVPASRAQAASVKVAAVGRVETPLGDQGVLGAGANVGVIFNLIDDSRKKTDVEVQYGWDQNGDGKITDGTETNADGTPAGYPNEWSAATENRLDSRDTRANKKPQLFTTAGDIGAIQEYVWNSQQDLRGARLVTIEYALTDQGRLIPDPDNPTSFLFATGPGGAQIFAGVEVRVRAIRSVTQRRHTTKIVGAWQYSQPFSLNNDHAPSMTIDAIDPDTTSVPTASTQNVMIHWTVSDPDSEDLNGNGILDVNLGEDINGNGVLDPEYCGVAFDYHRLAAGENPATMTQAQVAGLSWLPCTRAKGVGDTDSLHAVPGVPIPTSGDLAGVASAPSGRHWTFAWNSVADVGTVYAQFIFRARPFDQKRQIGDYVYRTAPTQLDNWRIFNPGTYTAFPIAPLASGRVGHTITRIQGTVDKTDTLDRGDDKGLDGFQSVIVAGGSQSVGGAAVTDLDVMPISLIAAETTTTSDRIALHLNSARSYHTATALDDGRVLFIGGFDASGANPQASTEIYDPKTQTITPGPSLAFARAKHTAVKLSTGDVAVFGGIGAGGGTLSSCELVQFQPYADKTGTAIPTSNWTVAALPDLGAAQVSPHAVLLPDQTVLVTGGIGASGAAVQAAQLFNPINPSSAANPQVKAPVFIPVPSMLQARKYSTATSLINGNVLFSGGVNRNDFEIFNAALRTFEPVDPTVTMSVPRAQHVSSLLGDGSVLVAGGADDPDAPAPNVSAKADVVKIGARNAGGVWSASFVTINGTMSSPRRLARAAVIDNGRVFIAGGLDNNANSLASVESFTPANGSNLAPKARAFLPANQNSWLYGAPLYFRMTYPELDHAKVQVQYIDLTPAGAHNWRAATPQASTIGGDVAELTADLATTLTDDQTLAIDPVAHNTAGDHIYIWGMNQDIARPAAGTTVTNGYQLRVIPFGAVRGTLSVSTAISVLYNTKIVPTIWPFENYADQRPDVNLPAGAATANQAGDVRIWVHLRGIDGGPGLQGDPAKLLYEYAIDTNGDGLIKDSNGEFFYSMTPKGLAAGGAAHASTTNPQVGLATFYNAPADSHPAFPPPDANNNPIRDATHRPAGEGWTFFDWDSVYDIGVPPTSYTNIFIRVTPTDTAVDPSVGTGIIQVLHNINGQAPVFTVIRHPDSVYLLSWQPRYSTTTTGSAITKSSVPTNDPIDFNFNGQIDPLSVTAATLPVYLGTTTASQVRGQYTVVNNAATHSSLVTFWPDPQNLTSGGNQFGQTDASTVLYPGGVKYSIRIPGYNFVAGSVPPANPPQGGTTLRPLGGYTTNNIYSSYLLIQAVPINNSGTDANYQFTTAPKFIYAEDGGAVTLTGNNTASGSTITRTFGQGGTAGVQFTFSRALDPYTVGSPNFTTLLTSLSTGAGSRNTNPVVPGLWTVTNTPTVNGASVTTASTVKFVPLFQMPSAGTVQFAWNAGLKASNGHAVPNGAFSYVIETYTRVTNTNVVLETFTNQNQDDTTGLAPTAQATTASWGNEGCAAGTLSGGSTGLGLSIPSGYSTVLNVAAGTTTTLTAPVGNYASITVAKNGTLILACPTSAMQLNVSGNVSIAGTVLFKGAPGWNGVGGWTGYPYMFYGGAVGGSSNVRAGGIGVNGGGSGGSGPSVPSTSTTYRVAGNNGANGVGTTATYGQGGQIATETSTSTTYRYMYGAGGGAGGGNATAGLSGGKDVAFSGWSTATGYGAYSTPGAAANDAFLSSGMTGGGGGGGGGSSNSYSIASYGYLESGGGGAGAGAVSIVCSGTFQLTANGLINGRGGNGGGTFAECGAGGGGAGGNLKIVSFGNATFDGMIDLRGGLGGANGHLYDGNTYGYGNAINDHPSRYGGDGAPGRLLVVAPNFGNTDEVRVFGQMYIRQIAAIQTASGSYVTPPVLTSNSVAGFSGVATTGTYTFASGITEVDWTTLNIAQGSVIDLNFGAATVGVNPVKIFVQGAVTIAGTLRINGDSSTSLASGSTAPTAAQTVQNFLGRPLYPGGQSYSMPSGSSSAPTYPGMAGNMGGGTGGTGMINGIYAAGREAANGTGPAPGVHNMNTNTGYYYSTWYMYTGDTGGSGAANATDGEDGWAAFAAPGAYNYLGAFSDNALTGLLDQRGSGVAGQTSLTASPLRLGATATDVTSIAITNLASFVGSGGGGGNNGGDPYYTTSACGLTGSGGGGAGALAIISPVSITVGNSASPGTLTGEIDARGGDGQTPGGAAYSYSVYDHAGGGGGSGGTVYLMSDQVNIVGVPVATGVGGATIDLRGGLGGGRRSQNQYANCMAYPEYIGVGSFGGNGGYGRLVVDYKTSVNSGRQLANRWGYEQTTIDSASNTYRAMAGTARFYCPGMNPAGNIGRSRWYDMKSISPILSSFSAGTVSNATLVLRVEGAQSLPNTLGSPAGTWGSNYTANTGDPDPANTSGLFTSVANPIMTGWRFLRFDATFTRTTSSTGGPVIIDNMTGSWTSDL